MARRSCAELACAALLWLAWFSAGVAAAEPVRIVIAHADDDEISRRLRAETAALGLTIVDLRLGSEDARSTLAIVQTERARAALRVTRDGIEVLVLDPLAGAVDLHDVVPAGARDATAAVRAVEELRARLVKLTLLAPKAGEPAAPAGTSVTAAGPQRSRDAATVPADNEARDPAPTAASETKQGAKDEPTASENRGGPGSRNAVGAPRLWVGALVGGSSSAGGLGTEALAGGRLQLELSERWSASAFALLPVSKLDVSAQQGTANVTVSSFGAFGQLALLPRRSPIGVELGVGAGAALLRIDGRTDSPSLSGRSKTLAAPLALAEASLGWIAARYLRLHVDLLGGIATPRPTLRFDGHEVASWGRPFAMALLGFDIGTLGLHGEPE